MYLVDGVNTGAYMDGDNIQFVPPRLQHNFFQLTSLPPAQSLSTGDTIAPEYGAAASLAAELHQGARERWDRGNTSRQK